MNLSRCLLLVLLLLSPVPAFPAGTVTEYSRNLPADYRHSNMRFNNYPGSVFGPRIAWAEPYALGKLKLLVVLPWGAAHEAVELRARIPADISLITMAERDKWVNPEGGEPEYQPVPVDGVALADTAHRLLSAGYRYDAILIGKVKWSAIPPAIRTKILAKVKGGTALVWISPWDVEEDLRKDLALSGADNVLSKRIQATVPLGMLPLDVDFEQAGPKSYFPRRIGPPDIRTGKLGGGNVVWLDYRDRAVKNDAHTVHTVAPWMYYAGAALTPFLPDDDLYYDYYYSILGKALYHAAGKVTGLQVSSQQPRITVERQKLPGAVASFNIEASSPDLTDCSLICELRDRENHVLQQKTMPLTFKERQSSYAPPLPTLRQGTYVVDVWAMQGGAVLDWASAALVVTDVKCLETVQPAKEFFAPADRIRGTVKFATPPGKGRSTTVELWDTYDRLVAVNKLRKEGAEFDFPPLIDPLSRAYRVVAKVQEKDFVVDQAEAWVGLPSNRVDDYQFIIWFNAIKSRYARTAMRQSRQYAVTGYYDGTTLYYPQHEQIVEAADMIARNNLLANPYSMHAVLRITPEEPFQKTVDTLTNGIKPRVEAYRRYGVMAYSTCEECYIDRKEGAWDNPAALQDYRVYLEERYGDVSKLNEIWGSTFKDFTEISPISFMEAKTRRQPTRWLEQELHKVERFNRAYELVYQAIQKDDPGARMSFDCVSGMDYDWPRMAKIVRSCTQAPLEAFGKGQGHLVGTWIGYYLGAMDEWTMRTTPWQYLFQGGTHVHWWPGGYAFTADLSEPLLCMQQAAEECRELESGTGKLLLSSRKRIDPILFLWSNTSYHAGTLYPGEVRWESAHASFENMLRRTGLDYQAVGADFVEKELAYGDQQRVLILPACQSISRQGVEKIKAFAEAGGLVIADFPPAVMDEYLRAYGNPQAVKDAKIEFETCPKCKGTKRVQGEGAGAVWQTCPACGGTGQAMKGGETPSHSLLMDVFDFSKPGVKKVGKGGGLFLKGSPVRREEWGALRKVLVENAGIRGAIAVQDPLGNLRTDIRSYVFDNGRAVFLGILPDRTMNNPPGQNLTVKLGGKAHAYDVRRHQYLGETDALRTGILPAEAKLLAFLTERIGGLNVSLSKETGKPGEVVELKGSILPASLKDSRLVVHIEVSRDGKPLEAHTKNLAFQGSFSHPIPLALNQERGVYRVKIMEIISGYTQEVKFSVK